MFSSTPKGIKRRGLTFFKLVVIVFAREAVDDGSPVQKFFQLVMREISIQSIFHAWATCNHVSKCGLHFFLPIDFEDLEEFLKFMKEALRWSHGFGKL